MEEVLRRAAELTKRLIDYQIFSILLYDEATASFRHRVTVKFGQRVQEKSAVPAHEGIVGAAAKLRRPVVVPDVSLDPRYRMVNPETRSELAVPMIYKNRVVGVMDLESPQLNYFTPDHVQVLSILAAHLAVSIENARLYEQVARDESRMERDLNAARRIQGALLPRLPGPEFGLDIAARVVSSRELSGDLYDFIRYGPQDLGIALGDVSGKGSAAALYGAVAVGTLRSLGSQKPRPANMLRALNGFLGERLIEGRFMTLCFATWNRRRAGCAIANAGQEQPLLYHGGRCEKIPLAGFPLGIFRGGHLRRASYHPRSRRRDAVFTPTESATRKTHAGEFFGHAVAAVAANYLTRLHRRPYPADGICRTKSARRPHVIALLPAAAHPADDRDGLRCVPVKRASRRYRASALSPFSPPKFAAQHFEIGFRRRSHQRHAVG